MWRVCVAAYSFRCLTRRDDSTETAQARQTPPLVLPNQPTSIRRTTPLQTPSTDGTGRVDNSDTPQHHSFHQTTTEWPVCRSLRYWPSQTQQRRQRDSMSHRVMNRHHQMSNPKAATRFECAAVCWVDDCWPPFVFADSPASVCTVAAPPPSYLLVPIHESLRNTQQHTTERCDNQSNSQCDKPETQKTQINVRTCFRIAGTGAATGTSSAVGFRFRNGRKRSPTRKDAPNNTAGDSERCRTRIRYRFYGCVDQSTPQHLNRATLRFGATKRARSRSCEHKIGVTRESLTWNFDVTRYSYHINLRLLFHTLYIVISCCGMGDHILTQNTTNASPSSN